MSILPGKGLEGALLSEATLAGYTQGTVRQPQPTPAPLPPTVDWGGGYGGDTTPQVLAPRFAGPRFPTAAQNAAAIRAQLNAGAYIVTLVPDEGIDDVRLNTDALESLIEAQVPLALVRGIVTVTLPPEFIRRLADRGSVFNIRISESPGDGNVFVTAAITVTAGGINITTLGTPYTVLVDLAGFDLSGLNTYRISAVIGGRNIGGAFIPAPYPQLRFDTVRIGTYQVAYVQDLVRATVLLGSPDITDLTGNSMAAVMDAVPVIIDDRALVPVRFIAENILGLPTLGWNADTITVDLSDGTRSLSFVIGQPTIGMDIPAQIIVDRALVPIR